MFERVAPVFGFRPGYEKVDPEPTPKQPPARPIRTGLPEVGFRKPSAPADIETPAGIVRCFNAHWVEIEATQSIEARKQDVLRAAEKRFEHPKTKWGINTKVTIQCQPNPSGLISRRVTTKVLGFRGTRTEYLDDTVHDKQLDRDLAQFDVELKNAQVADRLTHAEAVANLRKLDPVAANPSYLSEKAKTIITLCETHFSKYKDQKNMIRNPSDCEALNEIIDVAFGRDSKLGMRDKHAVAKTVMGIFDIATHFDSEFKSPSIDVLHHYIIARANTSRRWPQLIGQHAAALDDLQSSATRDVVTRGAMLRGSYEEICKHRDRYDSATRQSAFEMIWNASPNRNSNFETTHYAGLLTTMIERSTASERNAILNMLATTARSGARTLESNEQDRLRQTRQSSPDVFAVLRGIPLREDSGSSQPGKAEILANLSEAVFPANPDRRHASPEEDAVFNTILEIAFDPSENLGRKDLKRVVKTLANAFSPDFSFDTDIRPTDAIRERIARLPDSQWSQSEKAYLLSKLPKNAPNGFAKRDDMGRREQAIAAKRPVFDHYPELSTTADVESQPYFWGALSSPDTKNLLTANRGKFIVRYHPHDGGFYHVSYMPHSHEAVLYGQSIKQSTLRSEDAPYYSLSHILDKLKDGGYVPLVQAKR